MSGQDKGAWSTLPTLLAEKNLTVADLHQILRRRGFDGNKKSLYPLAASQPVQKLDTAIVLAVSEALEVRLQHLINFQNPNIESNHPYPQSHTQLHPLLTNTHQ